MTRRSRDSNATALMEEVSPFTRQGQGGVFMVIKGPDRGEQVYLTKDPISFGSSRDCTMMLSDETVSRKHLIAELRGDAVYIVDNNSTNGSYFDGARFHEMEIGFGAEVKLGRTVIKFLPDEEIVVPSPSNENSFGQLVGGDTRMRQLFQMLGDVAKTDATVLIEGETGTGKELIAEEIHNHSNRKNGPFVVFDCGSIPRELIESALFGHLKGSFTGAISDRKGAFVEANGGTIFLDEIGEMALDLQPSLLRVLDKRAVRRVGSNTYEDIDIRVIAATNRNLREEVAAKNFREDLYFRLAVMRVSVPPLRDRGTDVALLVQNFIERFAPGKGLRVDPDDLAQMERYGWPGNVRELRNAIERACLLAQGGKINMTDILSEDGMGNVPAMDVRTDLPFKEAKGQLVEQFEREYLEDLLVRHNFNLSAASREAKLDRKHLRELMRKYELEKLK